METVMAYPNTYQRNKLFCWDIEPWDYNVPDVWRSLLFKNVTKK